MGALPPSAQKWCPPLLEHFLGSENESFTITRQNYETSLLVLVKETQLYLLPEIFLELEQDKFTMVAKHFSGNILFIDNCGILRILVPLNENCVDINWEFICKNISKSKLLLPTNRHSNDLALRVIRKIHVCNNCCSKTYLAQLVAESYFVVNLDRLCGFVCNNCYMCLRKRQVQRKNFVQGCNFSHPKDYTLSLDIDRISVEINKNWTLDLIPRINIKNAFYHFVDPKLRETYKELHNTRIFCNVVILVNSRTGYVHLDITYTRKFEELKNILESFLHKYAVYNCIINCDSELSFIKLAKSQKPLE